MKMNDKLGWLLLAIAITGCSSNNESTSACGEGDEIAVEGESFCVYRRAVVVENGFMCPVDRPNLIQEGGIGVCSSQQTIPGGTLQQIGERYREADPSFEGCILDFECEAGEVCTPSGCAPVTANNSTVNNTNNTTPTNNTTGTNNGGTCAEDADCMLGDQCVNGICVAVCGGFAGFTCPDKFWCDYPADSMCGAADMLGICQPVPEVCTDNVQPVCGCDGADYSNECQANAAGVDAASDGTCN